jgi:hypothetical protein
MKEIKEEVAPVTTGEVKEEVVNKLPVIANVVFDEETIDFGKQLEENRVVFYKRTSKENNILRYISWGLLAIIAAITITLIILVPSFGIYIGLGVLVVYVIVHYFINRKAKTKFTAASDQYIEQVFDQTTGYLFNRKNGFDQVDTDFKGGFTLEEIVESGVYKDIARVISRTLVKVSFGKVNADISKCCIMTTVMDAKKKRPNELASFVGYAIFSTNHLSNHTPLNFYLRNDTRKDIFYPEGLLPGKPLITNDRYDIYGLAEDVKKCFTNKFYDLVEQLEINDVLYDVTIKVLNKKTYVYLNFTDDLMVYPYEKKVDMRVLAESKRVLNVIQQIVSLIDLNSKSA